MAVIDDYRRGWALRYLREARAELTAARMSRDMAPNLIFNALRKAQSAIYHSMGNPVSIAGIVQQKISEGSFIDDPILKCLVEIEKSIQWIASLPTSLRDTIIMEAENIICVASEIVKLFAGEHED
ncbi:MAG: hypothetical protein ACE5NN_05895 [Candidatus Bathyarchaeia archaeon]